MLTVVAAVIVLAFGAYVIEHHDPVPNAGQIVGVPSSSAPATSSTPRRALTVAFLGDDYTAGIGVTAAPERFTTMLATALHWTERNFGVPGSGYASAGAGGNYLSRVAQVVAAAPDIIVVTGGRNDVIDAASTVSADTTALFAQLHSKLPHARLIAVAPFWGDSPPRAALATVAAAVKAAVLAVGGTYLDIPDPLLGHPDWMADDADPNAAGYAAIAGALRVPLSAQVPTG